MVLKHVLNALNLSYTCICQKCNAWTIFLMFQFLEFWTVSQFLAQEPILNIFKILIKFRVKLDLKMSIFHLDIFFKFFIDFAQF